MINRYSSRRQKLDKSFLTEKLKGAKSYDRIAGYFSSSILEIAGEAIEQMEGCVRIICNSDMAVEDVRTASAAQNAMRREWCGFKPEKIYSESSERLIKLYNLLKTEKLKVKVIPNNIFGLIHGKAGVITLKNGEKTAFIGSVNETLSGWKLNYEILWEDNSKESVEWVQEEFDFFWNSPYAVPLSDFVIEDIKRISKREVIDLTKWAENLNPASPLIETPVYRQEFGLWEHQKYFIKLAFEKHQKSSGARFVLADMVGLGKTVQLALSAQLMALYGDKPIIIIVPKTLVWQWQDELNSLLDMPSAVWTGREWIDENGIKYPCLGETGIKKCPRKIGIISQGLITSGSEIINYLLNMDFECVIIDEAHRARRKNRGKGKENQKPEPNNLMDFLLKISKQTKSMLLATATPVQIYPIEAWDLLNILSQGSDNVMGSNLSMWRKNPERALNLIMEKEKMDATKFENWEWIRNPFPETEENTKVFGIIRSHLNIPDEIFVLKPESYHTMTEPDKRRLGRIIDDNFMTTHNPFIRHIIRRTRDHLESTINPETGEPYLKPIKLKLFGEKDNEAITLPPYLQEAYKYAEEFCTLLQKRIKSGGFLKTLLLKRLGSTIIAGENTAKKMLANWGTILEEDEDDEFNTETDFKPASTDTEEMKNITPQEQNCLIKFIETLSANKEKDPKYKLVYDLLIKENWIKRGCIIFSQFYDSVYWIAENLSQNLSDEKIGIYAGGDKSGLIINGRYTKKSKEEIKHKVKNRELKILIGTDAASEGLNLQTLGTLINLDLPWNPTRLEQRKGRIQRIGQTYDEVYIYNMRYKDSVEDRVHSLLSERFENIYGIFGQLPDVLEDVWINVALNDIEESKKIIDDVPKQHPFELRYEENVGKVDWESCEKVLDKEEKRKYLMNGWE